MTNARWKIGPVQRTTFGPSWSHGYGFSIENFRGAPLLGLNFATKEEAEAAEVAARQMIEKAQDIVGHDGT